MAHWELGRRISAITLSTPEARSHQPAATTTDFSASWVESTRQPHRDALQRPEWQHRRPR